MIQQVHLWLFIQNNVKQRLKQVFIALLTIAKGGLEAKRCPTPPIPWTVTYQAPLPTGFPRQERCGGLPCPSPGDLPNPGTGLGSLVSPALLADPLLTEPPGSLLKPGGHPVATGRRMEKRNG